MRQPTIHQMREKKNHRGKVKTVERLQYLLDIYRVHIQFYVPNVLCADRLHVF
jgi:hypothetical protein